MNFLSELEGILAKGIEGLFSFKGKIKPLYIANRLVREMERKKKISVNKIYVPDRFNVYLSPGDWQDLEDILTEVTRELCQYLDMRASEKEYGLAKEIVVKIYQNEQIPSGRLLVLSEFTDVDYTDGFKKLVKEGENEVTCPYQIIRRSNILEAEGHRYFLQVQNGRHRGQSFGLSKLTMVIGRRGNSDIVLEDETISRRHCQLEMNNESWQLTDLDSRNGTYVNGIRIYSAKLELGDSLKLGDILLLLKVE